MVAGARPSYSALMPELVIDDPYTGNEAVRRPLLEGDGIDAVLDSARGAARAWGSTEVSERAALCAAAVEQMVQNREAIASDITRMMGKPLKQAQGELDGMVGRARHMIDIAAESLADDVIASPDGLERRIERVPLGVVFNMPAWNYPLLTCVNVVIPAVLAGNAVLLKHSTRSALCGEHFADAFVAAGAPTGLVSALHCSHATAALIAADRRVGYVAFTGSVKGGHAVYQAVASGGFADAGLELGGKDAAYIADDADLARAVDGVVDGACYNAGQSCCGVERVYAHASVYDDVVSRAREAMQAMTLGDPTTAVDMGPMAQPSAPPFLAGQVEAAVAAGAEALVGGKPTAIDGKGRFFEPTLLVGVTHEMAAMREESFGPILPIMKVADDDEALALMNDSDLGLTASGVDQRPRPRRAPRASAGGGHGVHATQCDVARPRAALDRREGHGQGERHSPRSASSHLTRPRSWLNFEAVTSAPYSHHGVAEAATARRSRAPSEAARPR